MKLARRTSIEKALLKRYSQQHSCGVPVLAVELKSVAIKLANHMHKPFKASDGWLWHFHKRHWIMNKRTYGKASSEPTEDTEPFRKKKVLEHIIMKCYYSLRFTVLTKLVCSVILCLKTHELPKKKDTWKKNQQGQDLGAAMVCINWHLKLLANLVNLKFKKI